MYVICNISSNYSLQELTILTRESSNCFVNTFPQIIRIPTYLMTPVHQSIDANNLKSLKILTMCGGDHFALDMNNVSPLEMAAKFGNFEMVKFMVDHNFNEKDKEKRESLNEKFLSIKQNDNNDNDQLVAWDKLGNAMKYAIDQLEVGYAHGQILGYLVGIFMYENRMHKSAFEHLESEVFDKLPKEFHELGGLDIIQKPMETTKFLCNLEISMQIGTYFIEALSQGLQKAPKVDFILPMMKLFKIVPKILHFKSKQYDDLVNHFQKVVIVNEKAYNLLVQKLFLDHIDLVKKLISVITQFHSELKQDPHFAEGMLVEQMKSIGYGNFAKFILILLEGDCNQIGNKDKDQGGREFLAVVEQFFKVTKNTLLNFKKLSDLSEQHVYQA